ncbi:hypothetical protein ABC255_15060 [Neobacillus sp. 3P2-tot-E-2]|uniref:hypothetical protein n=1 Tax=Neobacillus sp. 3P2-tot-E-2 TaxID=3132212 RepID=UPI0039A0D8D2
MKKIFTLLCTSLIVLLMFVGPGNSVKAANPILVPDLFSCGCEDHGIYPITGSEKNKIVAELLSSDAFKTQKSLLNKDYTFKGVNEVQVAKVKGANIVMVAVPFFKKSGTLEFAMFTNGESKGMAFPPTEEDHNH